MHTAKLGRGGHSSIAQLGNDPAASFAEQCALVASCLAGAIRRRDTTYSQERVALGRVLQHRGRRDAARARGGTFFHQPGQADDRVAWPPYQPAHIDIMRDELHTDCSDLLGLHAEADAAPLRRERAFAQDWRAPGKVRQRGLGLARWRQRDPVPPHHPLTGARAPENAFNRAAAALFVRARELGLRTIALAPFMRGGKRDAIGEDTAAVAAILLRWVAAQPLVDQVIVARRKQEWVQANLAAVARGPRTALAAGRRAAWGCARTLSQPTGAVGRTQVRSIGSNNDAYIDHRRGRQPRHRADRTISRAPRVAAGRCSAAGERAPLCAA